MRPMRIVRQAGLILAAMAASGCDGERTREAAVAGRAGVMVDTSESMYKTAGVTAPASLAGGTEAAADEVPKPSATAGRKIVYNGSVDLVTEDLGGFEAKLTKLVAERQAYVADSDRAGSAGSNRRGTWKVRVPVDGYDGFVKGVVALGELVNIRANSQDVSEEYFDLDARQVAKKVEEQRLLKHLTDSTGKLEEILAVERELSRVRIEIERMQGRLRALANLTTLATVTITASEIKGYVPPQAPTLGTKVARTFAASLESLQQFGETVLIACVAITPWLPLIALVVGVVAWIIRRAMVRPSRRIEFIDIPPPPRGRG